METGIEREVFLRPQHVRPRRRRGHEDQIPTPVGNRARYDNELVLSEQCVSERLLTRTRNSGSEPIGIWD
jgi:hypothetical protein